MLIPSLRRKSLTSLTSLFFDVAPDPLSLALLTGRVDSIDQPGKGFLPILDPDLEPTIPRHWIYHPRTGVQEHPESLVDRDPSPCVSKRNVEIRASRIGFQGERSRLGIVRIRVETSQDRSIDAFPSPGEGQIESTVYTPPLLLRGME
jgi:hypothetical protein